MVLVVSRQARTGSGMTSLVLTRGPTRTREARRRASTAPARAAATLPRRPLRFKSRRPRYARPGSCVTWRAGAAAAEAAGMGRDAAELHQEYYRRRSGGTGRRTRRARMRRAPAPSRARTVWAACPACADASRAGAGPGRSKSRRNITAGRHPSPQGLRPDGPRTAEVAETYMARRGFCTGSHDPPGSAVGKDSDEALHRIIQMMPFAGYSNLATVV
jgi:hypothetical protein